MKFISVCVFMIVCFMLAIALLWTTVKPASSHNPCSFESVNGSIACFLPDELTLGFKG